MTTYVGYINQLLKEKLASSSNVVSFGQNIGTGSCLSGLTRGLPTNDGNVTINSTNTEYSLTGAGFGIMADGSDGIYFMKQQDFLLLGIDHLTHTWNALRTRNITGSFTICAIVVDNGFEGPQSCINKLPDLCSISRIPGYSIANKSDAESVIDKHLVAPGVRIIGISQKMYRTELPDGETHDGVVDPENMITRYGSGDEASVVSLNFAFPEAKKMMASLEANNANTSLFNIAAASPSNWSAILEHAAKSKRVVICDDSTSQHKASTELAYQLISQIPDCKISLKTRSYEPNWSVPNADLYAIDTTAVLKELAI
jgi:pyruvate/2-oxoglutarate/acetoin dehydrogenase E1 component